MNALIIGDSHSITLRTAQEALAAQVARTNDHTLPVGADAEITLTFRPMGRGDKFPHAFYIDRGTYAEIVEPGFLKRFERIPEEGMSADWLGFSAPFHSSRIWRADWQAHVPWPLRKPGQQVSTSVVNQIIEDDLVHMLGFLDVLHRNARVFVIESPAPFRHHRAVARNGTDTVMLLHTQHRTWLLQALAQRGIPVITNDPDWLDADGFMHDEMRSAKGGDQHHGNSLYGQRMLARIRAFLRTQTETSAQPSVP